MRKLRPKFIAIVLIIIIGLLISVTLVKYPNILQRTEEPAVTTNTVAYFENISGFLAKPREPDTVEVVGFASTVLVRVVYEIRRMPLSRNNEQVLL